MHWVGRLPDVRVPGLPQGAVQHPGAHREGVEPQDLAHRQAEPRRGGEEPALGVAPGEALTEDAQLGRELLDRRWRGDEAPLVVELRPVDQAVDQAALVGGDVEQVDVGLLDDPVQEGLLTLDRGGLLERRDAIEQGLAQALQERSGLVRREQQHHQQESEPDRQPTPRAHERAGGVVGFHGAQLEVAGSTMRYPTPHTVWISCGSPGSSSMRARTRRTCRSTVRASPL